MALHNINLNDYLMRVSITK